MQISPESIQQILLTAKAFALKSGFSCTQTHQIELGLEEALANVWKHGYQNLAGPVHVKIQLNNNILTIVIEDQAAHFDPTEKMQPIEFPKNLQEARIGGLGLPLMKSCFDEVLYQKLVAGNRLTLLKKLNS